MDTKYITIPVKNHTTAQIEASEGDYWVLRRKLRRAQRDNTKLWQLFILMTIIAGVAMIVVGVAIFKLYAIFGEMAKLVN